MRVLGAEGAKQLKIGCGAYLSIGACDRLRVAGLGAGGALLLVTAAGNLRSTGLHCQGSLVAVETADVGKGPPRPSQSQCIFARIRSVASSRVSREGRLDFQLLMPRHTFWTGHGGAATPLPLRSADGIKCLAQSSA